MIKILIKCTIRFYKLFISPILPPACRYYPSCSDYAMKAVDSHGVIAGSWLSIRRLLRCHPFTAGGFDPVPATETTVKID